MTETAHDFLIERDGVDRIQQLYRLAVDDESFDRLLDASVRNFLRSRARATERGALIRRLRSVLEGDSRFCTVQEGTGLTRWTLSATRIPEVYTGQLDRLIAAARTVEGLRVARWRSTNRHGPVAERESLVRLCEAILRAAGTSMRVQQIADVVAARFNLYDAPLTALLDDESPPTADDTEVSVVADEQAEAIWEQLTARERAIFRLLDKPARVVAGEVGLGKSQVAVAQARIRQLLQEWLSDEPAAEQVYARLELLAEGEPTRTAD